MYHHKLQLKTVVLRHLFEYLIRGDKLDKYNNYYSMTKHYREKMYIRKSDPKAYYPPSPRDEPLPRHVHNKITPLPRPPRRQQRPPPTMSKKQTRARAGGEGEARRGPGGRRTGVSGCLHNPARSQVCPVRLPGLSATDFVH